MKELSAQWCVFPVPVDKLVKGGIFMALLLWQFWIYSFLGYLLERLFAAVTRADNQVRRCFLLLPMCPVYGLGVLAVTMLPPELTDTFWDMALWGGLTATAVEYTVHLLYERILGVRFWDYAGVWGNLAGRICIPFSVIWGVLLAMGLPFLQQLLLPAIEIIPPVITYAVLMLFATDVLLSARFLRQTGNPIELSGVFW